MYLSIVSVKPLEDYCLELVFENNEIKKFDMNPYLETGIFKKLKDEKIFNQVKISFDTIEWPGGIDLDPEVLYEKGMLTEKILPKCFAPPPPRKLRLLIDSASKKLPPCSLPLLRHCR
ncbi:MAG: DUF2442 domain-containing protein [Spirochaetaceae bacterium]|jgi:hypothetical protein|nr:DUF2442 domain-containing protein [Spirochaetaceae bacterium]